MRAGTFNRGFDCIPMYSRVYLDFFSCIHFHHYMYSLYLFYSDSIYNSRINKITRPVSQGSEARCGEEAGETGAENAEGHRRAHQ